MKKIEDLSKKIENEITMANDYMKCAIDIKEADPVTAETYYKIAFNKMNDMNALHDRVAAIIEEYRKEHGDPPESMRTLYNILHKKHIENAASVKGMMELYKEM